LKVVRRFLDALKVAVLYIKLDTELNSFHRHTHNPINAHKPYLFFNAIFPNPPYVKIFGNNPVLLNTSLLTDLFFYI